MQLNQIRLGGKTKVHPKKIKAAPQEKTIRNAFKSQKCIRMRQRVYIEDRERHRRGIIPLAEKKDEEARFVAVAAV